MNETTWPLDIMVAAWAAILLCAIAWSVTFVMNWLAGYKKYPRPPRTAAEERETPEW